MSNDKKVVEAFEKHEVVPDVISKAPEKLLTVAYDGGVEVNLGAILTPTQVQNEPKVSWDAEPNELYTLIFADPDAPSRKEPKLREVEHWLVINIPGNYISKGETLAKYIGAGAPEKTGLHRYVFILYKQPNGKIEDPQHGILTYNFREKRRGFKTESFVKKHNLGDPVAGNFFQAEYDDYVLELRKKTD